MITITHGDILKSNAEALINTVNCVGVMGRGIAAQFKKAFPENFKEYKAVCTRKGLHPGMMLVHDRATLDKHQRYIINFPTKRHWKGKSKLEDIESGLKTLVREIQQRNIHSVAVPPLGCGLGGLEWPDVRHLIEQVFVPLSNVEVLLYEPKGAPKAKEMINRTSRPDMTHGRAALLGLMKRYLSGFMDVSITLLEIQKLMYFMQEAGEHLKLKYTKQQYGPYAPNLGHVLSHIEGHFVTGYGDGGNNPNKLIQPLENAISEAQEYLNQPKHEPTQKRFQKVSNLIDGFEDPYGMELLATTHWVACHEGAKTVEQAIIAVHCWNDRKKRMPDEHIKIAWNRLSDEGWLI